MCAIYDKLQKQPTRRLDKGSIPLHLTAQDIILPTYLQPPTQTCCSAINDVLRFCISSFFFFSRSSIWDCREALSCCSRSCRAESRDRGAPASAHPSACSDKPSSLKDMEQTWSLSMEQRYLVIQAHTQILKGKVHSQLTVQCIVCLSIPTFPFIVSF